MRTEYENFSIQNGGCIVEASMPLKDQGLVFIKGENLDEGDSNGSGKTTLLELLYTCVYGKTTKSDRRTKKSDLLNVQNPKDFLLNLQLTSQSEKYTIKNFRAHSKLGTGMQILKGLTDITPDDPREAQKAAQALVGLTSNEYLGSVYLSQRYTHMMIDGTPAQKKEYLSRYFGLDTLDTLIKETTKRVNGIPLPDESHLKSMLEGIERDLLDIGDVSSLQDDMDSLLEKQKSLQAKMVDLKVTQSKQEEAKSSEDARKVWKKTLRKLGLELDLENLKVQVHEHRKNLASTEKSLAQARKRVSLQSNLDSLIASGQSSLDISPEEVETELEKLSSSVSKLERRLPKCELREKLELQLKDLPETEEDEEALSAKHQKWRKKLKDTQAILSATQSELNKLSGVGDVCYTCQRSISSEEKEEMVSERTKSLVKLKKALSKAQEASDYYSDSLESLQARAELLLKLEGLPSGDVTELNNTISSLRQRVTVLHRASAHVAKLQSLRDQIADLPDMCDHLEDMEAKVTALTSDLDTVDSAHRWLLQHGTAEYDAQAAQRTQGMLANTEAKVDECSSRLVEIQEKLARYKGLKRQKSDLNKTLNKTSAEKQRHRVLKYLTVTLGELKKDGLRESTTLLSNVLPLYLNQLFPEGDIQLAVTDDADGFDLMFNKGGYSIPLTMISGGQAKRVGLAIIFSFAKMGRNTTNLLICDEPFRDLDQRGREACFELLKDFDMGTILVTSHDVDMQASRKYDQVWTVRMKNHQSRLYLD